MVKLRVTQANVPPRRRLGGFSWHGHVQIGPWVGPSSRQIGMGQHLAVVGEQPRDVAEGPRLQQLDPQLRAIDRVGVLPTLQSAPGTPIPNSPYCEVISTSATGRCEALRVVLVAACPVHSVSATDAATTSLAAFNAPSPSAARVPPQSSCSFRIPLLAKSRRQKAHGALTREDLADHRADPTIPTLVRSASNRSSEPGSLVAVTRDIPPMSRLANQTQTTGSRRLPRVG